MRAPATSMNCPRGGRAFSTRRAVIAVNITNAAKLSATSATVTRRAVIIVATSAGQESSCDRPRAWLWGCMFFGALELHCPVVHSREAELQQIQRIILMQLPRPLRALLRKYVLCPLDVAGAEINRRLFRNRFIALARRAAGKFARVHVLQQAAHILRRQIGFQGPGSVGVAKR